MCIRDSIMIDGDKMSASKGNVVYPKDWLECAPPELLRFFYNKKLMKTRSFSWKDLPKLYDDYDEHAAVYFGDKQTGNEKEDAHMKRLFEISQTGEPRKPGMPFSQAVMLSQMPGSKNDDERVGYAATWVEKHSPGSALKLHDSVPVNIRSALSNKQAEALRDFARELEHAGTEDEIKDVCFEITKKRGMKTKDFFTAAYMALIGKERGPRLAPFILAAGKERIIKLLKTL